MDGAHRCATGLFAARLSVPHFRDSQSLTLEFAAIQRIDRRTHFGFGCHFDERKSVATTGFVVPPDDLDACNPSRVVAEDLGEVRLGGSER